MSYPRIPSYLITDERGRRTYQLGDIRTNDPEYAYDWSEDNSHELELGILHSAETIAELAKMIGAQPAVLQATIDRWNAHCDLGGDEDFGRPPGTMMRIDTRHTFSGRSGPRYPTPRAGRSTIPSSRLSTRQADPFSGFMLPANSAAALVTFISRAVTLPSAS